MIYSSSEDEEEEADIAICGVMMGQKPQTFLSHFTEASL